MKVKLEIDNRTFIRFLLVVSGFALTALLIWTARSALVTLFIALYLALALNPPVTKLAQILPGRSRVGATAIAYITVVALLGGFIVLVAPPVIDQTSKFIRSLPQFIDQASQQQGALEDFLKKYNLQEQFNDAVENAKNQVGDVSKNVGNRLVNGANIFFGGIATLIFVLVLTFLMLIEGPQWMKRIWGLYEDPDRLDRHREVVSKMYHVVTGYVNGQIFVAATASVVMGLVLTILLSIFKLSLASVIPLAAVIFICGLIPMIGAILAMIIVTTTLLFSNLTVALIFLVSYIVYQQIENNLIQPAVQARTVELSALTILGSILIGVSLFGPLGGIVAIPIAGCVRVLLMYYLEHAKRMRDKKRSERSTPLGKLVSKLKGKTPHKPKNEEA